VNANSLAAANPTAATSTGFDWEAELLQLLNDLSEVQGELLAVLGSKRKAIAHNSLEEIQGLQVKEQQLSEQLESCHSRRQQLLENAKQRGMPGDSIAGLSKALPTQTRDRVGRRVRRVKRQTQLVQNECLTNWVLTQRSLLHLSQLMEIFAGGGKTRPTYGKDFAESARGGLVDGEA
jgi:hypothetical protein